MKALLAKLKSETFTPFLTEKSVTELYGYHYHWSIPRRWKLKCCVSRGLMCIYALSEQGIQVLSMRNKANRLEELLVLWLMKKR